MHKQTSFPLRIEAGARRRAQRLARHMGLSENRLYADLIQEGLLMREQMAYFEKLRSLRIPAKDGIALLDQAPNIEPDPIDKLLPRRTSRARLQTS